MARVLVGATLIDGTGADPVNDAVVVIDDDRIVQVGGDVPSHGDVLDCAGLTLTPGLIDAHVHLGASSDPKSLRHELSVAEIAADIFANCEQTLEAGFTTVRDTGGIDAGVPAAIASGRVSGPRVLHCGPIQCQTGGHGHFAPTWEPSDDWCTHQIPGLTSLSALSDSPDEIRKNVREAFRRGASFIKLCVTGGVVSLQDSLTDTQFTIEEIATAVAEARARGTYVTVHAHNNEGVRNAIEAGVRCVEHGTALDEETAAIMAERGVALVPTLAVASALAENAEAIGLPPQIQERVQGVAEGMGRATTIAQAAGVRVGLGSDLIGPDQTFRGLELVLRSAIDGPMSALVSATSVNAEILGLGDQLGTVEVGKIADLVGFDGNPMEEPKLFNDRDRVSMVVQGGKVVKNLRAS